MIASQGNGGNKGGNRGEGEEEVPAWCNPQDPMGAWMNYIKVPPISYRILADI